MIRSLRSLGVLTAVWAVAATGLAAGPQNDWSNRDFDATRVAVRAPHAPSVDAEALPIPGWWFVPNRGAQTEAGAVDAALAELERGAGFATPVLLGERGGPVLPTPELLVGLAPNLRGDVALEWLAERTAGRVEARYPEANVYRVELELRSGTEVLALCDDLARAREVRFAEPDLITSGGGSSVPNDPEFVNLWGLENTGQFSGVPGTDLGALDAWTLSTGSAQVPVVVIDVGVDSTHADLNVLPGKDFTNAPAGTGEPLSSCDLHGTLVAGTICARKSNGIGVVGIAPDSPVISARCFVAVTPLCTGAWFARVSWTADALQWSNSRGYRITNNSNFYNNPSLTVEALYASTRSAGMVHVASSGNSGAQGLTWPARVNGVISVGSYNSAGARSNFSNFGPQLDLMAPGELIRTTDLPGAPGLDPGDYKYTVGTSVASPYVAGVAALLLSREPGLSSTEVEARLIAGAIDMDAPGRDDLTGYGRIYAPAVLVPCESPTTLCDAALNSVGRAAKLSANGAASLSGGSLSLTVTDAVPGEVGIFFYGPEITHQPFGNGMLCVGAGSLGLFRVGGRVPIDALGQVHGSFDFADAPLSSGSGEWTFGSSWTVQFYYRDLAGGGSGTNLSEALRLTVCP
ncbi:MAG: S8 family serine peptidase [Planctomycetes bacterium]|nr:S8 family serine peptidase [Planctomycetota bacterium]